MKKFLKFFIREVVEFILIGFIFMFASVFLGLGIAGIKMFIPEILSTDSTLGIIGYAILLGGPFIVCYEILNSLNRAMDNINKEARCEDKKEVVKETRTEKRARKLRKKLEKEGVFIIW